MTLFALSLGWLLGPAGWVLLLAVALFFTLVGGWIGTSTVPPPVGVSASVCASGWHEPL